MPIARITGRGLAAIALSVAALWGCIVGERITLRRVVQERAVIMRDLNTLRQKARDPLPASAPAPRFHHPVRALAG
jgi:hypothetical protein